MPEDQPERTDEQQAHDLINALLAQSAEAEGGGFPSRPATTSTTGDAK